MDFNAHFSAKKKKDLVAIAMQFGLLTVTKANAMTKDDLVHYLASQQSGIASSEEVNNQTHSSESTDSKSLSSESVSKPDADIKSPSRPQRQQKNKSKDETVKADNVSVVTEVTNDSPSKSSKIGRKRTKALPNADVSVSGAVEVETGNVVSEPERRKVSVAKKTKASGQPEPVFSEKSTKIQTTEEIIVRSDEPKESVVKRASRSRGANKEVKLPLSDAGTGDITNIDVTSSNQRLQETQVSSEATGKDQENIGADKTLSATPNSEGRSNSSHSKLKRSRGRKRSMIITPQDESLDNLQSSEDNAVSSAQQEASLVAKDAATVTLKRKDPEPVIVTGILEIMSEGFGFIRTDNYLPSAGDVFLHSNYIRRFNLRTGDQITGPVRPKKDSDKYAPLQYIKEVNGLPPEKMMRRPHFDKLTPIYPDVRYVLETHKIELSTRIIDLIAPIGKGQRGMIVSPPKAGKTILLQKIANAISTNNPDSKLIVLLIDERPEEVTDMQRSINGEVVYSTFDKKPENHTKIVELVLERAMRLVELGQDVVILLDSMTRLSRAYNLTINPTGRTLSGGLDPGALYGPKRFFGAARNIENGGSLTIIATSLIDTGSRMDEVIFEEFKGTGNMEVYLDRKLSEKRIFPAIDINKSGTRREELLLTEKELDAVWSIRKAFGQLDTTAVTEMIINLLLKTQSNQQFVQSVNVSFNDKAVFEAMRGTRPAGTNTVNNGNGNLNK